MIAGIILAAGASRRMGSPKALLDYAGETFAGRLVRVLGGVCDSVIMVLGYHEAAIRAKIQGPVNFVVNPDPDRGQLSSLQTGLAAVPENAQGFMFMPVDCPAAEPATVAVVAERFMNRAEEILFVVPSYRGRHGHPVCAAMPIRTELLALPATGQAREVVHRYLERTVYVDVDDPGILTDVDDPEAYRQLSGISR